MFFFVKARIDINRLMDYGQKLQSGALKTHPLITYCLSDEPSIGLNIWEAEALEDFEKAFSPHREFYSELIEVVPVIPPQTALKVLMGQIAGKDKI
jgi:hypothetical protein